MTNAVFDRVVAMRAYLMSTKFTQRFSISAEQPRDRQNARTRQNDMPVPNMYSFS